MNLTEEAQGLENVIDKEIETKEIGIGRGSVKRKEKERGLERGKEIRIVREVEPGAETDKDIEDLLRHQKRIIKRNKKINTKSITHPHLIHTEISRNLTHRAYIEA